MSDEFDIHFPFAGMDISSAFCKQPNRPSANGKYARTAVLGKNVRAYDADDRARGGSRAGLSKYISTQAAGTEYLIQELALLVSTGLTAPGGGAVQPSQSGRAVYLVAVSQGNVYVVEAGGTNWTAATNGTGETPPLNLTGTMQSASNIQKLFFADGTNRVYYDPTDNTLKYWALTAGEFPADSDNNYPRLICTWRGRTVMAGLVLDPSVIFMSAVSDPFNFEYSPPLPVPPDSAWSGHTGPQGYPGDVITALIPYTDDVLIIGMDSSIALFRGDPNYGGQIDNVTTTIGIAWGKAWCMDSAGVIYFFSNRTGVFAFVPGNQPERISQAVDSAMLGINTGENCITMQWNDRFQQLHVWVTLLTQPMPTTHYVWEKRANAWWQDEFANANHNPLCCVTFDGNEANDRQSLIGSWTGYCYSISSDATTDDGEAIESEVWIGPILSNVSDAMMLKEVQGVLAASSADVSYNIYSGETAEEALASTPVASGTWNEGRNFTDAVNRAGYAVYIQLTSADAWAMESIRIITRPLGTVRRRGK